MGATSKLVYGYGGVIRARGVRLFSHRVLVGASGAITAQDSDSGIVATKQGTAGQYLLQFPQAFKRITGTGVTYIGPLGANTTGSQAGFLTNNMETVPIPGQSVGTKAGNILLQWSNVSANAAADVPSGTVFIVEFEVEMGV